MLGQKEQVTILRLRTNHNRLAQHMFKTFGIGQSGECGQGQMTARHTLQSCPTYSMAA